MTTCNCNAGKNSLKNETPNVANQNESIDSENLYDDDSLMESLYDEIFLFEGDDDDYDIEDEDEDDEDEDEDDEDDEDEDDEDEKVFSLADYLNGIDLDEELDFEVEAEEQVKIQ